MPGMLAVFSRSKKSSNQGREGYEPVVQPITQVRFKVYL